MQKYFPLLALLLFVTPGLAVGSDLKEKVNLLSTYGGQYDAGELSYAQVLVLARGVGSELRDGLSERLVTGEGFGGDLTVGMVAELFGAPSGTTSWVQVKQEERYVRLPVQAAYWDRALFDGEKLKITVSAHPTAVRFYSFSECPDAGREVLKARECKSYTTYYLYDFVFNVRPKSFERPDLGRIENEVGQAAGDYLSGKISAEDLADLVYDRNNEVGWYVEDSKVGNDCGLTDGLFSVAPSVRHKTERSCNLREFGRGRIVLRGGWCADGCDSFGIGVDTNVEVPYPFSLGKSEKLEYDAHKYDAFSEAELKDMIREKMALLKAGDTADLVFLKKVRDKASVELEMLFGALNNKYASREAYVQWTEALLKEFAEGNDCISNDYTEYTYEQQISVGGEHVAFEGQCAIKPDGRGGSAASVALKGESFENVSALLRQKLQDADRQGYLLAKKNERLLLESSVNTDFLKWFLDDYVSGSPEKWQMHYDTAHNLHSDIAENVRETVKHMDELGLTGWPESQPIDASYQAQQGEIRFWEETKAAKLFEGSKDREIPFPYLTAWVFPPKEQLKEGIKKNVERFPELYLESKLLNDAQVRQSVQETARKYGGKMEQLIVYTDDGQPFTAMLITLSEDGSVAMRVASGTEMVDVKITIDLEFLYSVLQVKEQALEELRIYGPPWEPQREGAWAKVDKVRIGLRLVPAVIDGVMKGYLKVEPAGALLSMLADLQGTSSTLLKLVS